jgi:hypothetical protein
MYLRLTWQAALKLHQFSNGAFSAAVMQVDRRQCTLGDLMA